ncbi:SusF/SusE family outer membrane protein [Flavobacterium sp. J372]|uniref:SusE domain-containing protein n=1 Tax=Flavobacterium sp. J372 TaxID=2898436 RepID=UPI002151427C|nr:SusF/SusE family outer membrane protein [Flavobacterium sp. J372]MCR5860850.1 SusF/SusE family outer membrane protein [Flavobacterium sp. J372]
MKTKIKIALTALLFAGLSSCTDDDNFMITQQTGDFEILTPDNGTSVVLTPGLSTNPALTFTWTAAEYTTPTEVTYEVQYIKDGAEWDTFATTGATTTRSKTVTVEQLNGAAIASGLAPDVPGVLNVRVKASVGTEGTDPMYSDVINITVTPYVTYPYRDLFLVGSATAAGWDNNATTNHYAMYRDGSNENLYTYTGKFNAGEFKLIEKSGNWQPQWGVNGSTLAVNPGNGSDPGAFVIATAGYYTVTVDTENMTQSVVPFNEAGSQTFSSIAVIGSATPNGWNDPDTDLTQSSFDPHIWYGTVFFTAGGELKFRANNSWDLPGNWGGTTSFSGAAVSNGGNIPIGIAVSGEYKVWFNDLAGTYIYIPVQ